MNNPTTNEVLQALELTRNFHDGHKELNILTGLDLTVKRGECVAIIGRSGTGKSTLLSLLGLLDKPSGGSLSICGYDCRTLSQTQRTKLRGQAIGFIFQQHHLLGDFHALDNVLVAGNFKKKTGGKTEALELLDFMGLSERLKHRPAKLSGGEQQRVAIARALYGSPEVLLCDEPTGNLDPHTGTAVMEKMWGIVRQKQVAMVLVTHDMQIARQADRMLELREGKLVQVQS